MSAIANVPNASNASGFALRGPLEIIRDDDAGEYRLTEDGIVILRSKGSSGVRRAKAAMEKIAALAPLIDQVVKAEDRVRAGASTDNDIQMVRALREDAVHALLMAWAGIAADGAT